jgi:hypothetical protein
MKWVTRDFVHLDRVASPWLIKRFIDRDAVFVFVPWAGEDAAPAVAVPFALPGAEIGPHDAEGSTFAKLLAKYQLDDPALHQNCAMLVVSAPVLRRGPVARRRGVDTRG